MLFYLALVYELLYDRVFGSGEQVSVARKLLRKSDTIYPKEYMKVRELDDYELETFLIEFFLLKNLYFQFQKRLLT